MQLFEQLADEMSKREKLAMVVSYKTTKGKDREIAAEYDTFFSTVDLGSAIVPVRELKSWLGMTCKADMKTVEIKTAEAQPSS